MFNWMTSANTIISRKVIIHMFQRLWHGFDPLTLSKIYLISFFCLSYFLDKPLGKLYHFISNFIRNNQIVPALRKLQSLYLLFPCYISPPPRIACSPYLHIAPLFCVENPQHSLHPCQIYIEKYLKL